MNYLNYIKKQGFKKCGPFFIIEDSYKLKNKGNHQLHITKTAFIENGDLVYECGYPSTIAICKGYEYELYDKSIGEYRRVVLPKWNHFEYIHKLCNEKLYITVLNSKMYYRIMIIDKEFKFIRSDTFSIWNLDKDLFDINLQQVIGNQRFREYNINKIIK